MENQNNNKLFFCILGVIIVLLVVALCVLSATGTISFKNSEADNKSQNDMINNSQDNNEHKEYAEEVKKEKEEEEVKELELNEHKEYTEEEVKGLELYKLMTGNGTGPFKWKDNKVINYDEIISKMTNSYKKTFENSDSDHGFSIPFYEDGEWGSFGGWGTENESVFKDIKVISSNNCTINYEITYTYRKLGDTNSSFKEGKSSFTAKKCADNSDSNEDYSTGYKVESFDLIYGLKFN